jgi:drug/metabolite transporter (DMT)-like permease
MGAAAGTTGREAGRGLLPHRLGGAAAALLTVSIWAGWIVATRQAVGTPLGPVDIGLLRYGIAALLLAPIWWRLGLLPRGVPRGALALMVVGSGTPFFLIAATAMTHAPAAHAGALMPGAMPLWAGLIGWAVLGERLGRYRALGYALIAAGVLVLLWGALIGGAGMALPEGAWKGHVLFLCGGFLWAAYTHAFRRTGLDAFQAAAVVSAWSTLAFLALLPFAGTGFGRVDLATLGAQAFSQGILSGIVAIVAYGVSVRRLGSTQASAFSALVPTMAALGGLAFLGEVPGPADVAGGLIVGAGVLLATGLVRRGRAAG